MDPITRPIGDGGAVHIGPRDDPDRYQVGATVGMGGEGEVAHGVLMVEGVPLDVAVKMWRHRGQVDVTLEQQARAWQSQLRLVQSISHPGIVRMREAFVGAPPHLAGEGHQDGEVLYLVMSWAPGVDLTRWVADHRGATYDDVCGIVNAVAAALAHLHAGVDTGGQPILHRDLKPANVIVSGRDRVQIVDFGLASGPGRAPNGSGTPAYLAPEVALFGRFSPASDVFGLGALTYYLLVGDSPPQMLSDRYDVSGLRHTLLDAPLVAGRPAVADHVLAAMAPAAADRPTDVVAWAAGLRRPPSDITPVAAPRSTGDQTVIRPGMATTAPPPEPPVRASRGRAGPVIAVAAATLAVVATLGLLVARAVRSDGQVTAGTPVLSVTAGPSTGGAPATTQPVSTIAEAPTTTTPPTTRVQTTTTDAPTTTRPPPPPPPPVATAFVMPSRNIGCALSAAGARCEIDAKNWTAPQPGTPCSMTWGSSLQIGPGGAGFACSGDSLLGAGDVLGYGRTIQAGQYRCVSAETGVTCRHDGTGHAFTLAREAYDLF